MSEDIKIIASIDMQTKTAAEEVLTLKKRIKELSEEFNNAEEGTEAQQEAYIKLQQAQSELSDANKRLTNSLKKTDDSTKALKTSTTSLWKDMAKAIGIASLVSAGLEMFKNALTSNQTTANLFNTALTALQNAFNDLVAFLSNNVGKVADWFKGIFNDPIGAIESFGIAIKDNIIERFNSFLKMVGHVGDALKSLIAGNFSEAGKAAKLAAKEFVDVQTGINNTADKLASAAEGVVNYAKETWNAAKAQVELQNMAKLSAAQLQGLVEEYDRQAETQRQLRDDEFSSIEDRIAANEKLGKVLEEQKKAMLARASAVIASAQADLNANKGNIDLQVALTNAQNEYKGVLAQVNGLMSEQKVNATALAKEQIERDKIILESANKIRFERKKAAAELIEDELAKAQMIKQLNQEEAIDELQRLSDNINNTKAGTQARVDAEIAYNEKKKEIDILAAQTDANIDKIKLQRQKDLLTAQNQNNVDYLALKKTLIEAEITDEVTRSNKLIEIAKQEHDARIQLLNDQMNAEIAAAEKQGLDTATIKEKYNTQIAATDQALAASQKQLSQIIADTKLAEYRTVGDAANLLGDIIGKQTAAGKGLGIAQALINTYIGITEALKQKSTLPSPFDVIAKVANVATVAKTGFDAVKKITSVQVPGGGGGSSPTGSAPTVAPPILPQQSSTRLDSESIQAVGNAATGGTIRAFVLNSNIQDENEKIELINRQARVNG